MNLNTRKGIYGVLSVLTPIIGTVCGVLGGVLFSVANMYEPSRDEILHWKEYEPMYTNAVHFVSEADAKAFIGKYGIWLIVLALVFVAAVVGLCILTGHFGEKKDGVKLNSFDRVWTELQIVLFALAACVAVYCAVPIYKIVPATKMFSFYEPFIPNDYVFDPMPNSSMLVLAVAAMLACVELALVLLISMVKKIKAREFLRTALLGKAEMRLVTGVRNVWDKTTLPDDDNGHASKQLRLKYIVVPIGMILLAMTWVGAIVDLIIIFAIVPSKIRKYLDIRRGVAAVKDGDLAYRIATETNQRNGGPASDLDKLADDINQITTATDAAVQNELKNQRMKTDLISNVSHDLKTPLTSMISYLDILKKEGLDSPRAQEYLDIVNEKTQKLKTLTEDLFEAAKASSGNIPCEITTIDLADMLEQELAEMCDLLNEKGLELIKTVRASKTEVRADGRLLSRVIENLLANVSKYALEKSRVYIDLTDTGDDRVRLDIKNISRDQLNISPEELMERFTRGDDSRNTEGSGLGLAIAKDLTHLMGGAFDITIDGDMFKASVLL
ncbi:MAG: HAMP domain-containing histidine kinase [Mogibacterium sp.]|nr:HAMP domain-containing histidine kinase [Mogibacterium sp.]